MHVISSAPFTHCLIARLTVRFLSVAGALGLLFGGTRAAVAAASEPPTPIEIGSRLELSVDRLLVDRMDGVELRLHQPRKLPLADC